MDRGHIPTVFFFYLLFLFAACIYSPSQIHTNHQSCTIKFSTNQAQQKSSTIHTHPQSTNLVRSCPNQQKKYPTKYTNHSSFTTKIHKIKKNPVAIAAARPWAAGLLAPGHRTGHRRRPPPNNTSPIQRVDERASHSLPWRYALLQK